MKLAFNPRNTPHKGNHKKLARAVVRALQMARERSSQAYVNFIQLYPRIDKKIMLLGGYNEFMALLLLTIYNGAFALPAKDCIHTLWRLDDSLDSLLSRTVLVKKK